MTTYREDQKDWYVAERLGDRGAFTRLSPEDVKSKQNAERLYDARRYFYHTQQLCQIQDYPGRNGFRAYKRGQLVGTVILVGVPRPRRERAW